MSCVAVVAVAGPYPDPGNGGGGLAPGGPGGWVGGPGHGGPGGPGGPGYPGNPYPGDPGYPQPGYGSQVRQIYVNRNVQNESFSLRELAGIDRGYQGWEVVAVRANTRPNNPGRTIAQLLADGRVVADQVNPGYQINLMPRTRLVLDQNVRDLRLAISGGTYIDSIEIEVRNGGGYNPPDPGYSENIEVDIFRQVYGNDRVDLSQYIDMYRYSGRVVEQVVVTGSAQYNGAIINLVVDGYSQGRVQFMSGYSQRQGFLLRQLLVIGQAQNIELLTSGDMTVEHVTLVLR